MIVLKLDIKQREYRQLPGFKIGHSLRQRRKKSSPKRTNVKEILNLKHVKEIPVRFP